MVYWRDDLGREAENSLPTNWAIPLRGPCAPQHGQSTRHRAPIDYCRLFAEPSPSGTHSPWPLTMPTSRRRWYQFRLSTLLIVVTLLALPCGYFATKVEQARRQRVGIETIRGLGGSVHYDYEVAPGGFTLLLKSPPGPPSGCKSF
jgi:hypothetical protein